MPPAKPSPRAGAARVNVAAALLGWVLPGLGHLLIGQVARGIILAVTIGSLWMGGLLMGGISVVDRTNHPAWFLGQMFLAPSLVVNYYHHHLRDRYHRDVGTRPDVEPGYEPAFGKPEEQGTLYTALAGLLNLLACIDVLYREPQPVRELAGDLVEPVDPTNPDASPEPTGADA